MHEVGLAKSFIAHHRMPDVEGPESELHSHDYRLEAILSASDLDHRGMVCDLDVLDVALEKVVGLVADQNLEVIQSPEAEVITVEVLARWAHAQLASQLSIQAHLSVRAWESQFAFGGYAAPISAS